MGRLTEGKNSSEESLIMDFERKNFTRKVKLLSQTIESITDSLGEAQTKKMSQNFKRSICSECDGHGKIDGETCPKCKGTGLAEPIDERIYPEGKRIEKPRTIRKETR